MMSLAPFVLVARRYRGCRCFRYSDNLMIGVSGVSELASGAGRRFGVVVVEEDSWVGGGRYLSGKQRITIAGVAAVDLQSFECLLAFCGSCQFGSFDSRKLKLRLWLKCARYGPVGESFLSFASSFSVCRMRVTCCSFSVMVFCSCSCRFLFIFFFFFFDFVLVFDSPGCCFIFVDFKFLACRGVNSGDSWVASLLVRWLDTRWKGSRVGPTRALLLVLNVCHHPFISRASPRPPRG